MIKEEETTTLLLEIFEYFCQHKKLPENGIDMKLVLDEYYMKSVKLTRFQKELLHFIKVFSRLEEVIQEIENYYYHYHFLPTASKYRNCIFEIKNGLVPILEEQKKRLDAMNVFVNPNEKMVLSIEKFYSKNNRIPKIGELNENNSDMGHAICDYRHGKRLLTEEQKLRLEKLGIKFVSERIVGEEKMGIKVIKQEDIKLYSTNENRVLKKEEITKLLIEVSHIFCTYGEFSDELISSTGYDIRQFLCDCYAEKIEFTNTQIDLFYLLKRLISKTEKNIIELENYYRIYGCLPTSRENSRLYKAINDYKHGKIALTETQKSRLENIGALSSATEKMVFSIEQFYIENNRLPLKGECNHYFYDMGQAIEDYQNGIRLLTINQKMRLEKLGVHFRNVLLKEEEELSIQLVDRETKIRSKRLTQLKKEREMLLTKLLEQEKIFQKV